MRDEENYSVITYEKSSDKTHINHKGRIKGGLTGLQSRPLTFREAPVPKYVKNTPSGNSRNKKCGWSLRGQGKSRGANINIYLAWSYFVV